MIARWKPVHLGHAAVLEALVEHADEVLIGIGSSNRYDVRNPFTAGESEAMIRLVLGGGGEPGGYTVLPVPDLGHGPRWRAMVAELFGSLDLFVTANDYVRDLMREVYRVVHPVTLLAPERRVPLDATAVRRALAQGEGWKEMVPVAVANWMQDEGLDRRFRREFGLATLALGVPTR
jgi:nicotinamide-nucleotide adenylyltransferase